MVQWKLVRRGVAFACVAVALQTLAGCAWWLDELPAAPPLEEEKELQLTNYRIGSDDSLSIFVWRNPELSTSIPVRPDGKITTPLIEDLQAVGKTPTELARDVEKALGNYIQDPIVTVIVQNFVGLQQDRVRVVGEALRPQALPYRSTMTLIDVMIAVGGTTDFAAGNRASLTRRVDGVEHQFRLRIDDLLKNGDLTANVRIEPGDVIVIPEAWF